MMLMIIKRFEMREKKNKKKKTKKTGHLKYECILHQKIKDSLYLPYEY